MEVDEVMPIRFYCSFTGNGFVSGKRYFGFLTVFQKNNPTTPDVFSILLTGEENHTISVCYHDVWYIKELQNKT